MRNDNLGIEEAVAAAASLSGAGAPAGAVRDMGATATAVEPRGATGQPEAVAADARNLDMIMDVTLKVTVELGRTRLKVRDILNLAAGSVVELNRTASEPVDILVNGALLASGEVVVVDDNFAVRITKLLSRAERLKKLF